MDPGGVELFRKIHALREEIDGTISVLLVDDEISMLISSVGSKVNPEMIGAGMSAFSSSFNAALTEMGNGAINETAFAVGGQFHATQPLSACSRNRWPAAHTPRRD